MRYILVLLILTSLSCSTEDKKSDLDLEAEMNAIEAGEWDTEEDDSPLPVLESPKIEKKIKPKVDKKIDKKKIKPKVDKKKPKKSDKKKPK